MSDCTPGPWAMIEHAGGHSHGIYSEADPSGQDVALVRTGEADARLVAAAPEMLAALVCSAQYISQVQLLLEEEPIGDFDPARYLRTVLATAHREIDRAIAEASPETAAQR
jgi:hypothetical protein